VSYTRLSDSEPIARKKHHCTWCGQHILVGEKYVRISVVFDGEMQTNKFHKECDAACADEASHEGGSFEFVPGSYERPERETAPA
jgi:hypothetical protein